MPKSVTVGRSERNLCEFFERQKTGAAQRGSCCQAASWQWKCSPVTCRPLLLEYVYKLSPLASLRHFTWLLGLVKTDAAIFLVQPNVFKWYLIEMAVQWLSEWMLNCPDPLLRYHCYPILVTFHAYDTLCPFQSSALCTCNVISTLLNFLSFFFILFYFHCRRWRWGGGYLLFSYSFSIFS